MRLAQFLLFVLLGLSAGAAHAQLGGAPNPEGAPSMPQIGASPTPLFMEIGPRPSSGAITLYNMSKTAVTVTTSLYNFELDESNDVHILPPTPQSMDLWMVVNPVSFTIPAGKSQTVRISVRPPVKPEPGEHRAIVIFSQKLDENSPSSGARVLFQIRVAVYGMAGNAVKEGTLHGVSISSGKGFSNLDFDITSTGNAGVRLQGQFSVWPKDKFNEAAASRLYTIVGSARNVPAEVVLAAELAGLPVLPGTRRTLKTRVNTPSAPGEYVLFIHGAIGSKPFKKSFPLVVQKEGNGG
jgi:hypothetical protein